MDKKNQIFLVTVTILEGRHYVWPNMDSTVIVRIDNSQKITAVQKNTDTPYYNEYFVFEFFTTLDAMLEKNINITVVMPSNMWRKRKILGYISLDVATVWQEKNHQFYHKWAILNSLKTESYSGPRGYLKLDLAVLAKGEIPKVPTNVINDEIEGNLLLPEGKYSERQKAKYMFDIYCCKSLADKPSIVINNDNDLTDKSKASNLSTFVEISFAGVSVRTSTRKNTRFPEFNEKLTIIDMFPPLCQTIKVDVCYGDTLRKLVHSQTHISLKQISNDKNEGFLPTLGPVYLHLNTINPLEGYVGSILMAVNTEIVDTIFADNKKGTAVETITPINEKTYFELENITIFAIVYEVTAISKRIAKKPISIRMTFGDTLNQKYNTSEGVEGYSINSTSGIASKKIFKTSHYLDLFNEKPCLYIIRETPYFKKRIYNSNILQKICQGLKSKMMEIEDLYENKKSKETSSIISKKLLDIIDFILTAGKKYVDIVSSYRVEYNTKFDQERKKFCLGEMDDIIKKTKDLDQKYSNKKKFRKLQKMYNRIEVLIDDVQDCWPPVLLWLDHENRHVSMHSIPLRDLIFSQINEEKGKYCGVKQTICFYNDRTNTKNTIGAKMEIKMYAFLDRHKSSIKMELPTEINFESVETLPRCLIVKDKKIYELRCYIFQGKIIAGFDKSGLGDPFVRILIQNQFKDTKVIRKCLNPIWDETLVFQNIIIDEYYVPTVLVEIYDKDELNTIELVGRSILEPIFPNIQPLKLHWLQLYLNNEVAGEILGALEYNEISETLATNQLELPQSGTIYNIPKEIKPDLVPYKVEVLFWGIRDLGKINLIKIKRPRITVLCGDHFLYSDTIENANKNPNFPTKSKSISLVLPLQKEYAPPLRIEMHDSRRFGVYAYAGVHISHLSSCIITPLLIEDRQRKLSRVSLDSIQTHESSTITISLSKVETLRINIPPDENDELYDRRGGCLFRACRCCFRPLDKKEGRLNPPVLSETTYEQILAIEEDNAEDYDWWTKFYASLENVHNMHLPSKKRIKTLKIYDDELELQPEFNLFSDMLTQFEIMKGKRTGDKIIDKVHIKGIFKGAVKIYPWPLATNLKYVSQEGFPLEDNIFSKYPDNEFQKCLLRVYVIRALNLRPKDLNGTSDPYLVLKLNDKIINDRENYVAKSVNPIFGRCLEFKATFPLDYLLKISVWDMDITTTDDLIGETEIDVENRFYTKHMAQCGISETYDENGYNAWRGQFKPSTILHDLCKKFYLPNPEYEVNCLRIGSKEFFDKDFNSSGNRNLDIEVLALYALRRWHEMPLVGFHLVPEHVETRSLFHPTKPGIEQGKLQLWIDIFPAADLPPPDKINIKVRQPIPYQLRVIIWNTDEVKLEDDDYYSGDKKCDIYVKGWMADSAEAQCTDVHYRSLTGEGNFNWRFIFNFEYLATENKMVIRKKDNVFSLDKTELKIPCNITLQIWDNDTFSKDDFLGTVTLELSKLHRPAKAVNKCTLQILQKGAPTINLFKVKRTKGWWPLRGIDNETQKEKCMGKIEAELELLTLAEAEKEPAGVGRHEPQALSVPSRPDTSFSWFRNPMKAIRFLICKVYKWRLILCIVTVIGIVMGISLVYSLPKEIIKSVLHI